MACLLFVFCYGRLAMPCLRHDMKARHSILPREISSPQGNMVQMKVCKENILPKVVKLPLFVGCAPGEIKGVLEEAQGKLR